MECVRGDSEVRSSGTRRGRRRMFGLAYTAGIIVGEIVSGKSWRRGRERKCFKTGLLNLTSFALVFTVLWKDMRRWQESLEEYGKRRTNLERMTWTTEMSLLR